MSILNHIDYLHGQDGVSAVVVRVHGHDTTRGPDDLIPLATTTLNLQVRADAPCLRSIVGKTVVLCVQHGDERVAVVYPNGHPISKSLQRTIERSAARANPPARIDSAVKKVTVTKPADPAKAKGRRSSADVQIDYARPLPTEPTRPF